MKNNGIPKLERWLGARYLAGFQKFARLVVRASGHPMAFALELSEADLDRIKTRFEELARKAREEPSSGQTEVIPQESHPVAAD